MLTGDYPGCSTRRDFCKCGVLRQLQSVVARCTGPAYAVILKKILRAVEELPITPEEMHQHSSAHGSFADTLWALGGHSDSEVSVCPADCPICALCLQGRRGVFDTSTNP